MRLNLGTVGALAPAANATTQFTPLVRSSDDAQLYDLDYVKSGPRPDDLLRRFEQTGESYVIAARLSGPVASAFDGPPGAGASAEDEDAAPRSATDPAPHLARSEGEANIILFADSDIFDDRFWVQTQSYLGERVAQPIADNASFIVSAIDNLMGSNELISLRARAKIDRPFTVVDDLRRTAERRFLAEQETLERRIAETERRLTELQTQGPADEGLPDGATAEAHVENEIQVFRAELLDSRKKLRDVQRNLRREIDGLGARLRFINVGLIPLLIAVVATGAAIVRYRRRKARVEKGA